MSFHYPIGGAGAGVTSVTNSDGTLTISPTTGAVIASINLTKSNGWTPSAGTAFLQNGIATTPTMSITAANATLSTALATVQISPAFEFRGHSWQTGAGGSEHTSTFRMYQIPVSGATAGATHAGTLQFDSSKDGAYTLNIMNLGRTGILTTAQGFVATNGSITASQGSVNAFSQVNAGTDFVSGVNGTYAGHLWLLGGTSGSFDIKAPAVVTSYELTLPGAQGLVGEVMQNDGSGVLSWVKGIQSVKVPISSAEILSLNSTPKQLVAAPGAGKIIEVTGVVLNYTFGTTAYAGTTTLRIYELAGSGLANNNSVLGSVASTIRGMGFTLVAGEYIDNAPLMIETVSGDPTLGDGTLEVTVNYMITTL